MCQREQKMEKHGGQSWITLLNCKRENIDCCDCFVVVTRTRRQTLMVCLLWWFDVWSWMLQWLVTNGVVVIDFGHDGFVESSDDNALCCCGSWNHKHLTRMMVVDVWCHDHEQRHVALPQTFMLCSVQGELWMHCCVHWKQCCWEVWWRQWIVDVEWQWHMTHDHVVILWFCDFVTMEMIGLCVAWMNSKTRLCCVNGVWWLWLWKWLDQWILQCTNGIVIDGCWLLLIVFVATDSWMHNVECRLEWWVWMIWDTIFLTFRSSENSCVTWLLLCAWLCVEQRLVVVCVHGRVLLLWMLWQEWLHVDSRRFSDLLWLCLWKCLWVNVFCLFFDCVVLCCVVEHEKMSAWKLFVVVFICCCLLWKLLVWSNIPIFDKTMLILCGDVFEHKHNNNMKIVKRGNWAIVFDECNVICKVFEMLLNVDWFVSICVVNEWTWDGGDWTGARSERDCVQWLLREWFHGLDCCDCCNAHTREKRHLLLCDCCERNLSVDGQWCERLIVDLLIVRHVECWWIEDEWWNFVVDCWRWMERCGWFVNCECVMWEAFFFWWNEDCVLWWLAAPACCVLLLLLWTSVLCEEWWKCCDWICEWWSEQWINWLWKQEALMCDLLLMTVRKAKCVCVNNKVCCWWWWWLEWWKIDWLFCVEHEHEQFDLCVWIVVEDVDCVNECWIWIEQSEDEWERQWMVEMDDKSVFLWIYCVNESALMKLEMKLKMKFVFDVLFLLVRNEHLCVCERV